MPVQNRFARRSNATSVRRQIIQTTRLIVSGIDLGAKRVVTAGNLSLKEIRQIRAHIPDDMEIETFIHGAMCISYSGRCLLSNYLHGKRCQSEVHVRIHAAGNIL